MECADEPNNNPNNFIKSLYGKKVYIKLTDDSEYTGNLICLDGLMNIVIENCEEIKTLDKSNTNYNKLKSLKETYIRGNNILYVSEVI